METSYRFSRVGEFGYKVFVYDRDDKSCELVSENSIFGMHIGREIRPQFSLSKLRMLYPFETLGNVLELPLFTYKNSVNFTCSIIIARTDEFSLESTIRRYKYLCNLYGYNEDYMILFNIGTEKLTVRPWANLWELHLIRTSYYYMKPYIRKLRGVVLPVDMFLYIMQLRENGNIEGIFSALCLRIESGMIFQEAGCDTREIF